jgi:hypothetical protein
VSKQGMAEKWSRGSSGTALYSAIEAIWNTQVSESLPEKDRKILWDRWLTPFQMYALVGQGTIQQLILHLMELVDEYEQAPSKLVWRGKKSK